MSEQQVSKALRALLNGTVYGVALGPGIATNTRFLVSSRSWSSRYFIGKLGHPIDIITRGDADMRGIA